VEEDLALGVGAEVLWEEETSSERLTDGKGVRGMLLL